MEDYKFEFDDCMKVVIMDYLDCEMEDVYNCENCPNNQECYSEASTMCNSEFAEMINYGGYDSEEEFWNNLLD